MRYNKPRTMHEAFENFHNAVVDLGRVLKKVILEDVEMVKQIAGRLWVNTYTGG